VYSFQENGKTITNKDFLGLLTGEALIAGSKSPEVKSVALTMGTPDDGILRQQFQGFSDQDRYDLKILIDGKTFKREFIHHFNISDSAFKLEKNRDESSGKKVYSYTLTADPEAVDVGGTQVKAIIKNSQDNNLEQDLKSIGNQRWEFAFTPVQTARYDVSLVVNGKHIDGTPLLETINADSFYFPNEASVLAAQQQASEASSSIVSSEAAPTLEPEPEPGATPEPEHSNLWLYIGIAIGNILVFVLGYLMYRLIAGGRDKDDDIETTLETDISSLQKSASVPTGKTIIDVADETDTATIPMNEDSVKGSGGNDDELKLPDDLMADNLFPLDNMEEPGDKDKT
jgi:hypothetical protein